MTLIDKSEILWLTHTTSTNRIYLVTSNKTRDTYFLYEVVDGKPVKTKYKNANPTELNKYVNYHEAKDFVASRKLKA